MGHLELLSTAHRLHTPRCPVSGFDPSPEPSPGFLKMRPEGSMNIFWETVEGGERGDFVAEFSVAPVCF